MLAQTSMLFDFTNANTSTDWLPVNDSVMGGVSDSALEVTPEGNAHFAGTVSLENNGGFASIRTLVDGSRLEGHNGIRMRVKGDGNTYSLRLRTNRLFDGVSFRAMFETTEGEWIEIDIPFGSFTPTFRGRTLRNVGPLEPASVRQMGILISDKQAGPFSLYIDWIAAYK